MVEIGAGRGGDRALGRPAAKRQRAGLRVGDRDRNVDQHRAGARLGGDRHRLVGDDVGAGGAEREARLGDRVEDRTVVEDLVGVGQRLVGVDAAGQHDQRHPVLLGVGDDVDGVGDAGADGGHQHGGRAGHVVHALGHEAGIVLVLAEDEGDPGLLERVDQRQHLAAGHAEGVAAAGLEKPAGQQVGGAERRVRLHRGLPWIGGRAAVRGTS